MSDPTPSLTKAIQSHFAPALRHDGFAGTSQRYWRITGGQCQVVEVQGSQYGGRFAVNMGIQPLSVPLRSGDELQPKRLRQRECLFRRRLALHGGDQWWAYQPDQQSMDDAACDACEAYQKVGRDALAFMAQPASPMNTLTPEAFAAGTFDFKGFGNTVVLMAWALAHMRKATGRPVEAREFARAGLKVISERASALKAELRELLETV